MFWLPRQWNQHAAVLTHHSANMYPCSFSAVTNHMIKNLDLNKTPWCFSCMVWNGTWFSRNWINVKHGADIQTWLCSLYCLCVTGVVVPFFFTTHSICQYFVPTPARNNPGFYEAWNTFSLGLLCLFMHVLEPYYVFLQWSQKKWVSFCESI